MGEHLASACCLNGALEGAELRKHVGVCCGVTGRKVFEVESSEAVRGVKYLSWV